LSSVSRSGACEPATVPMKTATASFGSAATTGSIWDNPARPTPTAAWVAVSTLVTSLALSPSFVLFYHKIMQNIILGRKNRCLTNFDLGATAVKREGDGFELRNNLTLHRR